MILCDFPPVAPGSGSQNAALLLWNFKHVHVFRFKPAEVDRLTQLGLSEMFD